MADLPDVTRIGADEALAALWHGSGLPGAALARASLPGADPVFASSFGVATAAQTAIAASALAATEVGALRWPLRSRLSVTVDIADAARECTGTFTIDGERLPAWDPLSGLYRCGRRSDPDRAAGWVRIHANFAHHRDGALRLLGLGGMGNRAADEAVDRPAVEAALAGWRAEDVEDAADEVGLPIVALRTPSQWEAHPQAAVIGHQPLVAIERIADAPPRPWPSTPGEVAAPLAGIRVLDLTRVLAGPVGCRHLADLGADVLTVHSPGLPNIHALPDTSRGKRSAEIDLADDSAPLRALVADADVFVQAARPGAIAARGFGPRNLARLRPGIVAVDLDAWSDQGPWGGKRGFDSLVQTVCGLNEDERMALGRTQPQPLPIQILDYATGFLAAFGAQVALLRQRRQGGSWRVHVSLARTARWLRSLGRYGPVDWAERDDSVVGDAALLAALRPFPSDFGRLAAMPSAARFSRPWPVPAQPSRPPGSDPARWW